MDFYKNNSFWKIFIAALAIIIVLITMFYSQYLAKQLREREEATIELYVAAVELSVEGSLANGGAGSDYQDNLTMEFNILEKFNDIMPIILEDEVGHLEGHNYSENQNENQEFLKSRKQKLLDGGFVPLIGYGSSSKVYYEHSRLYKLITYFPIAQILLLGTFVLFGYFFLISTRRAEQNNIWAGMAKETAHQLGTPISAIIGWIEHLKDISKGQVDQLEVVEELQNDVDRLELIADRFSKIGSKPDLKKTNLYKELDSAKKYMARRASKRVVFDFPSVENKAISCNINSHLFSWVFENLLRNALDAMEDKGTITAKLFADNNMAHIELSDTGKGIPTNQFKDIFRPGFTTKKRGWGLGLSLTKRIIENYHNGKIFIKHSKINEGTTFTILIPLA